MKAKWFILASAVAAVVSLNAAPTLGVGTPGSSYLATPTGPNPSFGTLFNFNSLTPGTSFSPSTYASQGVSISSPDGLTIAPFSTQSSPNELFDTSADGSANIFIKTLGTNEIGIGIADSDPVSITLQALDASGAGFGSLFSVTVPVAGSNPGNGYFTLSDAGFDIYGIQIVESVGNTSFSGLAVDDLQVAPVPEPAALALFCAGALLIGASRLRKRS